ncbi:MAG: peptidase associated/transthyretin-like domain-containing protein [Gemmatimonadales bacterium]
MRADAAHLTARVWDEARKALFGTVITRAQDPPRMYVEMYRRQLTPGGWIAQEQREAAEVISDRPFVATDPVALHEQGWARTDPAGTVYFGPDAELLLSDFFLEDHCFRAVTTENRRLGLEFSPHRRRKVPEIAGTLWLDPATMKLRSLDFRFVNLDLPDRVLREARFGGRLTFDRLATGGWYIRDWNILTPYLRRHVRINRNDYVVAWYQDVGGTARPIGAQGPMTTVVGQVFDSIAHQPIAGASISLGGAPLAISDSAGQFRFEVDRQGDYLVTVSHPTLTAVGLAPLRDSVRIEGREVRLDLASPSAEAHLALLCRRDVRRPHLGVLSGMVIDGPSEHDVSYQFEVPRSVARPQAALGYEANTVTSRVFHRGDISVVQVTTRPGRPFYICGLDRGVPIRLTDSLPGLPRRARDVAGSRDRVHVMLLGPS